MGNNILLSWMQECAQLRPEKKFDLTVKESFKTTKRELIPDPMNQSELAMRNAIQHSRLRVTKIRC